MKRLTLTYSVAPGPQRTISISLRRINLLLALFAGSSVWTAVTLGFVFWHGFVPPPVQPLPGADAAVAAAASTALIAQAPPPVVEAPAAKPAAPEPEPAHATVAAVTAALEALGANEADEPEEASADAEEPQEAPPLPAALTGMHFAHAGDQLQARFILENRGPKTLAGEISGEATFRTKDGVDEVVAAQATYKARLRTVKALTFVAPEGGGTFTGVKFVVSDAAKRRSLVANYDAVNE